MPIETSLVIKDFNDLFGAAEMAFVAFGARPFFRGQPTTRRGKKQWRLSPKILRNLSEDDASPKNYTSKNECSIFNLFRLQAPTRHASLPEIDDYARWMTIAQHYGLPTRLLDWTGSILVAAFFALNSDQKPDKERDQEPPVIWALDPGGLNGQQGLPTATAIFRKNSKIWNSTVKEIGRGKPVSQDRILAVVGEEVAPQMTVQQACFTFHESTTPLEEFHGADGKINSEDVLVKFEFSKDSATREWLHVHLVSAGIRSSTLFPDLSHLASDIERVTKNRRLSSPAGETPLP